MYLAKLLKLLSVSAIAISAIALPSLGERPKAPKTGTPSGNSTPGTTRPEVACPVTPKPLTAIFANQGKDYTMAEYPTFYFYIPYTAQQVSLIEFLIFNEGETETVYHSSLKLQDRPGIVKVQLPPEKKNALAVDRTYQWRFNLDCNPDETIAPDLTLNGWIRRVAANPDMNRDLKATKSAYEVYQRHDLWYDAIANLGDLYFANPKDEDIAVAWHNALKQLKLDWAIDESLVNSELKPVEF